MEWLQTYIMSVIAAAVLCAVSLGLAGRSGAGASVLRLVCGVIMAAVILKPLGTVPLPDLSVYFEDLEAQAQAAVSLGTEKTYEELSASIRQQTRTYIQNKAIELGAELEITVELDDGQVPVPVSVTLSGTISPTAKAALSELLCDELGIGKEDQIWK